MKNSLLKNRPNQPTQLTFIGKVGWFYKKLDGLVNTDKLVDLVKLVAFFIGIYKDIPPKPRTWMHPIRRLRRRGLVPSFKNMKHDRTK